jgi:hypothetical protein
MDAMADWPLNVISLQWRCARRASPGSSNEGFCNANQEVVGDLLFQAGTALMFSHHGFRSLFVRALILSSPETTRRYTRGQAFPLADRADEENMRTSEDLVPVGILTPTEGCEAWDQIARVAIRKVDQYNRNAPNILVVATDSNSINGRVLSTAVHLYDEQARSDQRLRRLNGFMLEDRFCRWLPEETAESNVYLL